MGSVVVKKLKDALDQGNALQTFCGREQIHYLVTWQMYRIISHPGIGQFKALIAHRVPGKLDYVTPLKVVGKQLAVDAEYEHLALVDCIVNYYIGMGTDISFKGKF